MSEKQEVECASSVHFSHSRMFYDTDQGVAKAKLAGNTHFGTLPLLIEAAADVACDRYASVRERALISLAALAKKEIPTKQC